jgi:uncharacterized protein (TIGR00297 family)
LFISFFYLSILVQDILVILFLLGGVLFSNRRKKLSTAGAWQGGLIGLLIYAGSGLPGLTFLAGFFILGTIVTSWKNQLKEEMGLAEKTGMRKGSQVWANAGVAVLAAVLSIIFPGYREIFLVAIASAFSSATADTVSSELGNLYGKRFFHILSFREDRRGLDGVVSMEGFLFGLAGSFCIAGLYAITRNIGPAFWIIVIAGTLGNILDSVLGAALERKQVIGNDTVNFLNTLFAGLTGFIFYLSIT